MSAAKKSQFLNLIRKGFIQFLPIAIGVYVGILAGNWNEDNKQRKNQRSFMQNVITELEGNIKRLDWSHNYHETIGASLDSLNESLNPEDIQKRFFESSGFAMINNWTGTGISSLSESVYETGVASNIFVDMDFETCNLLSRIYTGLGNYKTFTDPIMNRMLYEFNYDTQTKDVLFILQLICSDVKVAEKRLSGKLVKAIEKLEENKLLK